MEMGTAALRRFPRGLTDEVQGFGERDPPQGSSTPEELPTWRSTRMGLVAGHGGHCWTCRPLRGRFDWVPGSANEHGDGGGSGAMQGHDSASRAGGHACGTESRDHQAIGCHGSRSAPASARPRGAQRIRLVPTRQVLRHGSAIFVRQSRHCHVRVSWVRPPCKGPSQASTSGDLSCTPRFPVVPHYGVMQREYGRGSRGQEASGCQATRTAPASASFRGVPGGRMAPARPGLMHERVLVFSQRRCGHVLALRASLPCKVLRRSP